MGEKNPNHGYMKKNPNQLIEKDRILFIYLYRVGGERENKGA